MKGASSINMTQGDTTRLLIRFAIPMLIGNLFQQAYNLTDSMIVGQLLGSGALAAVGSTGSLTFLFFSVCNGVASGAGLMMATAVFLAAPAMLTMMGTPADILPDSVAYMRMSCLGVPLVAVYNHAPPCCGRWGIPARRCIS